MERGLLTLKHRVAPKACHGDSFEDRRAIELMLKDLVGLSAGWTSF